MKKPYQIESQRAVKQFAEMAAEGNPAVQMVLPLAEMIGWLRKGVGELIRQAGLQLMDLMMQEEVRALAGEPYQRHAEIRRCRARVQRSIRLGEERDQRALHRGEPCQIESSDGAPVGQSTPVRVDD